MCDVIPPQIYEALETVVNGDIADFAIITHDPNKEGEGFLGEVIYVTLEDKHSHQLYHLVVKQAFGDKTIREAYPIHDTYVNEIYFYNRVWPSLSKFQKRVPQQYHFTNLPKYFASSSEENLENLVLENLKFQDFKTYNKKVPLDKDHYEVLMKEYGKFHGVSFAYKTLCPKDYQDLVEGQLDIFNAFLDSENFKTLLRLLVKVSMESLQPEVDEKIKDTFRPYLEDYIQLFRNSLHCNKKYSLITHGDCWSNNMMFKYDEAGKVTHVKFLDFQMSREGSPCCDLSYCIYSGAPKEVLQDFDHYLKVYYNSLSATLKAFGCDPKEVYPYRVLKDEWKQYCKLGVLLGFLIWKIKCSYEENSKDLVESILGTDIEKMFYVGFDRDKYNQTCRNLLVHLYENDSL